MKIYFPANLVWKSRSIFVKKFFCARRKKSSMGFEFWEAKKKREKNLFLLFSSFTCVMKRHRRCYNIVMRWFNERKTKKRRKKFTHEVLYRICCLSLPHEEFFFSFLFYFEMSLGMLSSINIITRVSDVVFGVFGWGEKKIIFFFYLLRLVPLFNVNV